MPYDANFIVGFSILAGVMVSILAFGIAISLTNFITRVGKSMRGCVRNRTDNPNTTGHIHHTIERGSSSGVRPTNNKK